MRNLRRSVQTSTQLMKAIVLLCLTIVGMTNVNAQSNSWQYPSPTGTDFFRSTSVMETFRATTANNFSGFLSVSRIRNASGGCSLRMMLTRAANGAVVSTKTLPLFAAPNNLMYKDVIPTAITYNATTLKYCVVGLAVTFTDAMPYLTPTQSWYMVLDKDLNILSKNVFSLNTTAAIANSAYAGSTAPTVSLTNTFVTDVCPVVADGMVATPAQNTNIATAGFAMTGVVSTGGNITPGGDIRYVFIAKIDNTTNIVAPATATSTSSPTSDQGARIINGQEGPICNQVQDPNRFWFPSCIIQINTGANTFGGYFIGGTGPQKAGNSPSVGTSITASPIVNGGGSIAYLRRGYNLASPSTIFPSLGNGNALARKYLPVGYGACTGAIWDATANEIRVVGQIGTNIMFVDKLTNVNSTPSGLLGQQINIFSGTYNVLPCFTMPSTVNGFYKMGKLFKANNPNALYGGSAKNTAITGMVDEAGGPFANNFEVPFLTWFDWNELNTFNPATWASQALLNGGEIVFYPRVNNQGSGVMSLNSAFGYTANYYPDHKTAMLPFNGQGVDEQFGLASNSYFNSAANFCISTTEWYNYSQCNFQQHYFTNSTVNYTIDVCSPANTLINLASATNSTIGNPTVITNTVLPACTSVFFREANTNTLLENNSSLTVSQNANELVIMPTADMKSLKLYNLQGAVIATQTNIDGKTNMDISNLATGIYILQGIDANGNTIETKKVAISK